jgi:hypothetical protein
VNRVTAQADRASDFAAVLPCWLRRRLRARLFGTTGWQWIWWAAILSFPIDIAQGAFGVDAITVLLIVVPFGWALLELTAWASVDQAEVAWRGLVRTHRIPLGEVADIEESDWFLTFGTGPQLAVVTKNGKRLRITPSTWVGERARRDFEGAVRAAIGDAHRKDAFRPQ